MTRFRFLPACVFAFLLLCPALLSAREQTYRGLSDFARALSIIEKNYVDEISSEELAAQLHTQIYLLETTRVFQ